MAITSGASVWTDMQYVFPTGQNNGKVSQTIDNVTGEQVTYAYDALNRLISATASNGTWGEAYSYDGFGNLTGKTPTQGSAPAFSATFDPATNRQIGLTYDANGNALPVSSALFDVENRYFWNGVGNGFGLDDENYAYDPFGKRILHQIDLPGMTGYFYSITGQKIATYTNAYGAGSWQLSGVNVYFGSQLLRSNGVTVATDRLGSVRANANGERMSYFPYGEDRTSTADGREKFGSYFRDMVGQDYADQRYYSSINGRFWTADPTGLGAANPRNPLSWNRYAYASGDPLNFNDPKGLNADDVTDDPGLCSYDGWDDNPECYDGGSGGGGGDDGSGGGAGDDGCTWDGATSTLSFPGGGSLALAPTPTSTGVIASVVEFVSSVPGLFIGGFFSLFSGSTASCDTLSCQGTLPAPSAGVDPNDNWTDLHL